MNFNNRQFAFKRVAPTTSVYIDSAANGQGSSHRPPPQITQANNVCYDQYPTSAPVNNIQPYGYQAQETSYVYSNPNPDFSGVDTVYNQGGYITHAAVQYQDPEFGSIANPDPSPEELLQALHGFGESEFSRTNGVSSATTTTNTNTTTNSVQAPSTPLTRAVNMDAGFNTAAPAAAPQTNVFVKPSPRAPVKGMKPVQGGKRISRDSRPYEHSSDEETDNEKTAGEHTDQSDEEAVESPVAGSIHSHGHSSAKSKSSVKKTKKRRHSSRSSESSPERSPKRRSKETSVPATNGSHRSDKRSHKDTRRSASRSPSRSRSRSVSRARSVSSVRADGGSKRSSVTPARTTPAPEVRSSTPTPARSGVRIKNYPTTSRTPSTPSVAEDANNSVYKTIMNNKTATPGASRDLDNMSALTGVSKRSQNRSLTKTRVQSDPAYYERYLVEELRGTPLWLKTFNFILTMKSKSKDKVAILSEIVGYITFYRVQPNQHRLSAHRVQIDTRNYLMYQMERGWGYSYEEILETKKIAPECLFKALDPQDFYKEDHSLDVALRSVLKAMVDEIYCFDAEKEISIENAVLLNARYMELRLLQKLKEYYMASHNKDIIQYIMALGLEEEESDLQKLIRKSACRYYVRKLIARYNVTPENFDTILKYKSITPKDMRIWTDVETQRSVNIQINNNIKAVHEQTVSSRNEMTGEKRREVPFFKMFLNNYKAAVKPFLASHDGFLAESCKASELFSWLCFGLTTNDEEFGTLLMAQSFQLAKAEKERGEVYKQLCWNYPLAAMYKKELTTVPEEPAWKIEDAFIDELDGLLGLN